MSSDFLFSVSYAFRRGILASREQLATWRFLKGPAPPLCPAPPGFNPVPTFPIEGSLSVVSLSGSLLSVARRLVLDRKFSSFFLPSSTSTMA